MRHFIATALQCVLNCCDFVCETPRSAPEGIPAAQPVSFYLGTQPGVQPPLISMNTFSLCFQADDVLFLQNKFCFASDSLIPLKYSVMW